MERTQTLKPGLLVACATSVKGNVKYTRTDLETEKREADGTAHAKWQTEKTVRDAAEQERAERVRTEARTEIVRACAHSSFGLLCPTANRPELDQAIERAQYMVREFNKSASTTTVRLSVLCGQIASTDEEAARALNRELVDLIADMQEGIANANPGAIREAAKRAKLMESMLTEETAAKVGDAIKDARKAARELVKRVEKGAERAADVVAEINTEALRAARMSFLDLDDEADAQASEAVARSVEIDPGEVGGVAAEALAQAEAEAEAEAESEAVAQEEQKAAQQDPGLFDDDPLADIGKPSTPAPAALDLD